MSHYPPPEPPYICRFVLFNTEDGKMPAIISKVYDEVSLHPEVGLHIFSIRTASASFRYVDRVPYGENTLHCWEWRDIEWKEVDKNYMHRQSIPSNIWIIEHNLNKYPSVEIVDSAGSKVDGDIEFLTPDVVELKFSHPFSGEAYLN